MQILVFVLLIAIAMTACGSTSSNTASEGGLEQVTDIDRNLSIDDVLNVGWKKAKTYDVEGLDGAEVAQVGFWSHPEIGPLDYEIRVYPSHQIAVEKGTPFAEEASGKDALLNTRDATWDEGVKDRRLIVGPGSGTQTPRFGDYVILGNLVILCQGRNSEQALEQCASFVAEIRGG